MVLLAPPGARELPPPGTLGDAAAHAFDLALLASFEADQKQVEKVNRRVTEGRDRSDHHHVHLHIVAPSENTRSAATWILSYKPEQTDYLIRLGYEDAKRVVG